MTRFPYAFRPWEPPHFFRPVMVPHHVQAVQPRQSQIQDHQVHRIALQEIQRGFAILGFLHPIALGAKRGAQQPTDRRFVVHHQDA